MTRLAWHLLSVLAAVSLASVACSKERIPKVQVQDVKLTSVSLTTTSLEFRISIDNPNGVGGTLNKLTYETYFSRSGKWDLLGKGEIGETQIKAKDVTVVDIPYKLNNKEAILAIWELTRGGRQVDVKVSGSAEIKVGRGSFTVPFGFTKTVKQ